MQVHKLLGGLVMQGGRAGHVLVQDGKAGMLSISRVDWLNMSNCRLDTSI